jgi:opacity protein-like surface antigen
LVLLLAPLAVWAADLDRTPYASLGLGWNYAGETHLDDPDRIIRYDFGLPSASLALGLPVLDRWRGELELAYQENEPEILYFKDNSTELDSLENDQLTSTSFMLAGIRDLQLGSGFTPYLGLGVGGARVKLRFTDPQANDGEGEVLIDDAAWTFAYQLQAGVTVPITAALNLGIEYRFWHAPWLELEDSMGNPLEFSQTSHSGLLRLNYHWGKELRARRSVPAHPAPGGRGFYLAATAGSGWALDAELGGTREQLDAFAPGPAATLAMGYQLGARWRLELEGARRSNDMQIVDLGRAEGELRTRGDVRADSLALNTHYRFTPGAAVNALLGAGLGIARIRYDLDLAASGEPYLKDSATAGLFQWLLGFEFALTERWTVTTDYRMWIGTRVSLDQPDGTTVKASHVTHSMALGLRYRFPASG